MNSTAENQEQLFAKEEDSDLQRKLTALEKEMICLQEQKERDQQELQELKDLIYQNGQLMMQFMKERANIVGGWEFQYFIYIVSFVLSYPQIQRCPRIMNL